MKKKLTHTNAFWAAVIAEELARDEVGPVCLTPGGRNAPLAVALTENDSIRVTSHLDERSAGFFGLGRSSRTGVPCVLVSTSGTAAAEFHPAVLEASEARVPLLVLTADRPPELKQAGANQTVNQREMYGEAVRWSRQLGEPQIEAHKVRQTRVTVNRSVRKTQGAQPGPVHLNIPFRKPLSPGTTVDSTLKTFVQEHPEAADGRSGRPFSNLTVPRRTEPAQSLDRFLEVFQTSHRPLIHLGPVPPAERSNLRSLLQTINNHVEVPVLADPLSGQRYETEDGPNILARYEQFVPLLDRTGHEGPDLILRIGQPPHASHHFTEFCAQSSARQILLPVHHDWPERTFRSDQVLATDLERIRAALEENWSQQTPDLDGEWSARLRGLENQSRNILESLLEDRRAAEIRAVRGLFSAIYPEDTIFIGNSSPIRDTIDYTPLRDRPYTMNANRGASGIDGLIATTAGLGFDRDGYTVGILGYVSFYHDMNSLLAFRRLDIPAFILVINNDGGGIFQRLPIQEHDPPHDRFIRTRHGMNYEAAAEQFGMEYQYIESARDLTTIYDEHRQQRDSVVVELQTSAENNQTIRETIHETIQEECTVHP